MIKKMRPIVNKKEDGFLVMISDHANLLVLQDFCVVQDSSENILCTSEKKVRCATRLIEHGRDREMLCDEDSRSRLFRRICKSMRTSVPRYREPH